MFINFYARELIHKNVYRPPFQPFFVETKILSNYKRKAFSLLLDVTGHEMEAMDTGGTSVKVIKRKRTVG